MRASRHVIAICVGLGLSGCISTSTDLERGAGPANVIVTTNLVGGRLETGGASDRLGWLHVARLGPGCEVEEYLGVAPLGTLSELSLQPGQLYGFEVVVNMRQMLQVTGKTQIERYVRLVPGDLVRLDVQLGRHNDLFDVYLSRGGARERRLDSALNCPSA